VLIQTTFKLESRWPAADLHDTPDLLATNGVIRLILQLVAVDRSNLVRTAGKVIVKAYNLEPPADISSNEGRQLYKKNRREEICDPATWWLYFLHTSTITMGTTAGARSEANLLMFQNKTVQEVHIGHWYLDAKSPLLLDETMRRELQTTEAFMFSQSSTGVRASDRYILMCGIY
jgi:hypothetical protein